MWYDIELRSNNQRYAVSGFVHKSLRHRCATAAIPRLRAATTHMIYDSQQKQFHYDLYAKGDNSIRISSKFSCQ